MLRSSLLFKKNINFMDLVQKITEVTTQDNTTQHEYNTKQHDSTSTKEARAAKKRFYVALFDTELYIFFISFKNS